MTRTICLRWNACLVAATLMFYCTAVFAGPPTDFIKQSSLEGSKILSKKESKKRAKKLRALLQKTMDFQELAKRSLGAHWTARTPEEQKEFLDLLQHMLQANYTHKLKGKAFKKDYTITYTDEKRRGDLAIVKTKIKYKDEVKPIDYRLLHKDGKWVVINMTIDDISLEETYREDYTEIIKEEGWPALISKMKNRVKELEQTSKSSNKK